MCVLVVEDNAINQAVIKGMLKHAGYEADCVFNGEEAIRALEKTRYDLVIMDCVMPVMDGFEATRRIRAGTSPDFDAKIPILCVTALTSPEDRQRCVDAGASGYISKPVVARDLYAWIASNLGTRPPLSGNRSDQVPAANPVMDAAQLIRKMSPVLLRDIEQWRRELRTLGDNNQLDRLGALAHKIRGTADVLGFSSLSDSAARLEKSGKAGDAVTASPQIRQLIEELKLLNRAIQPAG